MKLYFFRYIKMKRNIKRKLSNVLFVLFLVITVLIIYSCQVFPALSATASSYLSNKITERINSAIIEFANENGYTDFICVTYSVDGKVSSLSAKVNEINHTRANVSKALLEDIRSGEISEIKIPIGCIFNSNLLYAKGPHLTFNTISSEKFVSKVQSEFTESGINQTIHRLYLTFSVDLVVNFPLKSSKIPIEVKHLMSEVVIVGDVPEAYTRIHRYFDDISESEIDDIYDFSASAN